MGIIPLMEQTWKSRLELLMRQKGFNMKSLSLKAELGETYVRDILKRGRDPGVEKMRALADVLGGQIQIYFDAITTSLPLYKDGKIKILGVTGTERSAAAPEIPTFVEAGYPDVVLEFRLYLLVPKGTPKAIVDKLNQATLSALADPEVKKRLEQDAAIPEPRSPDETLKIMKDENESMGKIIRALNISLN